MSKIVKIEEVYGITPYKSSKKFDGFKIETEDEELYFVIERCQNCCECWGYLSTPENLENYIGAEYLGYEEKVCKLLVEQVKEDCVVEDEMQFLNVNTSKGVIDFAVYNSHNGYYSHTVILKLINKKSGEERFILDTYL